MDIMKNKKQQSKKINKLDNSNIINTSDIAKDIYMATYIYIVIIIILSFLLFFSDEKYLNNVIKIDNKNLNFISNKLDFDNFNISSNLNNNILYPLPKKYNISSKFGSRYHPVKKKNSFHYGVDLAAPEGTNLIAVTNGIIVKSSLDGANGYSIWLKDDNNITYIYAHVNPYKMVQENQYITRGQTIGYVGPKYVKISNYSDNYGYTNGLLTGPHLHFGVRVNGTYLDPMKILSK